DLASEVVLAALIRDHMRPVPQMVALRQVQDADSPMLRDALRSLLTPAGQSTWGVSSLVRSQWEKAAEQAVKVLARQPDRDTLAFFLACLKSTRSWSARVDSLLVDAIVGMRARDAAGALMAIAAEKRERLQGGYGYQGLLIKPGDCEMVGAALLLQLDLEELNIQRKVPRSDDQPTYYGFVVPRQVQNPDRVAAYEAVQQAVQEAGPFAPVPGFEEALERMREGRER
ncbi:MAG: hypothetical protein ACYTGC_18250, partial [Planctomycetota bacterium]